MTELDVGVLAKLQNINDTAEEDAWALLAESVETFADEREQADPALDQQREALGECLAKLDGPARELLLERYAKERSLTDVAASMGRSRNSLYVMMHRIRQKLADCVTRQIDREGLAS